MTQVSQRTRIRETLICAIERGDYDACGGDFYARGHIRAIARGVGADPVPLIAAYDAVPAAYAHRVAVRLTAVEDRWVEFTTPGGGYLFQVYIVAGTSRRWSFHQAVDMIVGNPGGIKLTVDGTNPLPPGTAQAITLRLSLNDKISR